MSTSTGEKLRDRGCNLAEKVRPIKSLRLRLAILDRLIRGETVTADDAIPDDGGKRSNAVGAAFLALSRKRLIRRTGNYRQSTRGFRHGSSNPEWAAIDPASCRAEHARLAAQLAEIEPPAKQGSLFVDGGN